MTAHLCHPLQLLLVEDNRADAELAREMLREADLGPVAVTHVGSLAEAKRCLTSSSPACVLLDLGLPDAEGTEALVGVLGVAPTIPVVVLTGRDDAALGTEAVQQGAQDYMSKGALNADLLTRTIRYAIERSASEEARREWERGYRLLFEENPQPMWVYDERTLGFLAVNRAAIAHYGYSEDEFLRMTLLDIRRAEDAPVFLEAVDGGRSGADTLRPVRHVKKGGAVIEVELSASTLTFNGHAARLVLVTDITGRRQTEMRFEAAFHRTSVPAAILTAGGRFVQVNGALADLLGRPEEHLLRVNLLSVTHAADRENTELILRQLTSGERAGCQLEKRFVHAMGHTVWVDVNMAVIQGPLGDPLFLIVQLQDITARHRAQEALEERTRLALFMADVGVAISSGGPLSEMLRDCSEAMVKHLNAAFARVWTVSEVGDVLELQASAGIYTHLNGPHSRVPVGEFKIGRIAQGRQPHLTNAVAEDAEVSDQEWARREGMVAFAGYPLVVGDRLVGVMALFARQALSDAVLGAMASVANQVAIGIERKLGEAALIHQALHDSLTGLPNRVLLTDRLEQALSRSDRRHSQLGVMFLDLDHFKVVNDSLGHGAGDRLLVAVAERLAGIVRSSDTVARFGGDEFVIVCEEIVSASEALYLAERISTSLGTAFLIDGMEIVISVSLGLALTLPGESAEGVLRDADLALYEAKQRGRARAEVFDDALRVRASARLETENALRRAIDAEQFRLVYQPVVSLPDGKVVGTEALLRWQHPDWGSVSPADFIPLAEASGLIVPIGNWVMGEACRQTQDWRREGVVSDRFWVAINLSARQLFAPDLIDLFMGFMRDSGTDPSLVHLEITESVLMEDVEFSIESLVGLKCLGVRLAVDDFGTGYSSLSYLKRFPIDTLKIDRSFVDGLGHDANDSAIVTAVVALGHALGLAVLAEGVETEQQLSELNRLGCDLAQGYHFAKPLSQEQFMSFARTR